MTTAQEDLATLEGLLTQTDALLLQLRTPIPKSACLKAAYITSAIIFTVITIAIDLVLLLCGRKSEDGYWPWIILNNLVTPFIGVIITNHLKNIYDERPIVDIAAINTVVLSIEHRVIQPLTPDNAEHINWVSQHTRTIKSGLHAETVLPALNEIYWLLIMLRNNIAELQEPLTSDLMRFSKFRTHINTRRATTTPALLCAPPSGDELELDAMDGDAENDRTPLLRAH